MPITEAERKYLKKKHQGGKNNSKGNQYENFYAVYCLALLMDEYMSQWDAVYLTSQVPDAFVDDLLIEKPTFEKLYHQLKDVKALTWKSERLETDFKRQMEISQEMGESYHLHLVHSIKDTFLEEIPEEISSCTTATYFPACESLNQLLLSYTPFKNAISRISAKGDYTKNDELFGIAGALLGAWNSCERKNVSLEQIADIVQRVGKGYINMRGCSAMEISEECEEILNSCGLHFYINGIKLYWSNANGRLMGEIEWTSELEQKLLDNAPTDLFEVIELLS